MGLAKIFGQNVRRVRTARGVSLETLAHEVGLAYSYLGEIERGRRNPTLAVVERISEALKEEPVSLLSAPRATASL